MEMEAELKHSNDMKRIEAEIRGKAKVERENRDINLIFISYHISRGP